MSGEGIADLGGGTRESVVDGDGQAAFQVEVDQAADDGSAGGGDSHDRVVVLVQGTPGGVQRLWSAGAAGVVPVVEAADQIADELRAVERRAALDQERRDAGVELGGKDVALDD